MSDMGQQANAGWRGRILHDPDMALMGVAGAAAGLLLRAIVGELDGPDQEQLWKAAPVVAVATFTGAFVLLWPGERKAWRIGAAIVLAVLCAALTQWRASLSMEEFDDFALTFWILCAWPLLCFLILTLAATALEQRALRWPYDALFRHAVTLPVAAAMGVATGVAVGLFIGLWAAAFEMLGAEPIRRVMTDSWVLAPVCCGAAALGAAFGLRAPRLLGAGEAALLIGARILLPLLAVFSALFAVLLPFTGLETLGETLSPTGLLLALSLAAMLVFNGVYRDGETAPPALLRWACWLALAVLPVYAAMALYGISARIAEEGLTPQRIVVFTVCLLTAAYTVLLLAGLVSEVRRWRERANWMPPVAGLNTSFAMVWAAVIVLLQTPVLDPLQMSAADQTRRLESGRAAAADFDFAYLQFQLGQPGRDALERIEGWDAHPDAAVIGERIAEARAADFYPYRAEAEPAEPVALPPEVEAELAVIDGLMEAAATDLAAAMLAPATRVRALDCSLEGMLDGAELEAAQAAAGERRSRIGGVADALGWLFGDLNSTPGAAVRDILDADCPTDNPD